MDFRSRLSRSGHSQDEQPLALIADGQGGPRPRPRAVSSPTSTPRSRAALLRPLPLIGLALALVALLGYLDAYERAGERTTVLVATRDLPAGRLLEPTDLRGTRIAASKTLLARVVAAAGEGRVVGRRLASPVLAGMPLPAGAFVAAAGAPDSITLSVLAQHALGGALVPGERVTVLATYASLNGSATTRVVARGLEVLAVGQPPAGLESSSTPIPVTVALPRPALATPLALANSEAKLDLLLDEGANGSAPIPPASEPAS